MGRLSLFNVLLVCVLVSSVVYSLKAGKKIKSHKSLPVVTKKRFLTEGSCSPNEYACPERCIDVTWRCDGEDDCTGGTDEVGCAAGCANSNNFLCDNGVCIPIAYKCDLDDDCGDHSDEKKCPAATCAPHQFKCDNGQCIAGGWKCDGGADCYDQSDERNCSTGGCPVGQKPCPHSNGTTTPGNFQCIDPTWLCDGDNDCGDNSDETACSCTPGQFSCDHGGCVPMAYLCDGDNDCNDFSDEKCPDIPPEQCADKMSLTDCAHMNTSSFPICSEPSDAFKHCRKFCKMCEQFGDSTTQSIG